MGTELVSWDDVVGGDKSGNISGGGGKGIFLKLQAGRTYRVRPVGKPIEIWKYFSNKDGQNRSAITADPESCPVRQKYNLEPKRKYAINVIDREDSRLKVMEGPISVFTGFKDWYVASKKNPGGKDGGDFNIKIVLPPNGDKKKTKYIVTFIEPCPFTAEEKTMIDEQGLHKLEVIFKPDDAETIEKKLFGKIEPKSETVGEGFVVKSQPAQQPEATQTTKAKVSESLDF